MSYTEARDYLKDYLSSYVESITVKSKGEHMYVCPLCHSGEGVNGTGAFSIKGDRWKCFKCEKSGDIFDLYGEINGVSEYPKQLKGLCDMYNIQLDKNTQGEKKKAHTYNNIQTPVYTQEKETGAEEETDYTDFFLKANANIENTDYWKERGLSLETVNRFKLGYVESWTHPKAPQAPPSPRLIIPTSKHSYLARDTRAELTDEQRKYSKSKVGTQRIFNAQILQESDKKPIYIVEGEIDAMSIIEAGGRAVGLGSVSNKWNLLKELEKQKPNTALILALDNDKSGEEASNQLSERFKDMKVNSYRFNPYGECKDANEALIKDREALLISVAEGEYPYFVEQQKIKEEYRKENSVRNHIESFVDGIKDSVNTPYYPTGFPELDKVLDGGFYEGLYVVGAISSLGKTTLVTQIGDQIAKSGQDVLIFSLEMARTELMAKSISRHTFIEAFEKGISTKNAKTTRGITTYARYSNYSTEEVNLIKTAIKNYSEYAENIYIVEGIGDIGAEQIRKIVERHTEITGTPPVVVIDYVQILAPYNDRASDKQNMDKAVLELKRISRDFKTPVIAISSLNRANYNSPISMEALKETGGLEYGSDCVIGLQLHGVGRKEFDVNEAKKKNPREIDLVILKNRNGRTGDTLEYEYYPMFNYFEEVEKN